MTQISFDDKAKLIKVMDWYRQAATITGAMLNNVSDAIWRH